MSKAKPIGWITAGTLLCVAGVSIACRLKSDKQPASAPAPAAPETPVKGKWSEPVPYQPSGTEEPSEPPAPSPTTGQLLPRSIPDKQGEPVAPPPPPALSEKDPAPEATAPPPPAVSVSDQPPAPPPVPRVVESAENAVPRVEEKPTAPEPPVTIPRPKVVEEVVPAYRVERTPPPTIWEQEHQRQDLKEPPVIPPMAEPPMRQIDVSGMSVEAVAEQWLGDKSRWPEIYRLNPGMHGKFMVPKGTKLRLPADARAARLKVEVPRGWEEPAETVGNAPVKGKLPVSHLPLVRARRAAQKARSLDAVTGTFSCAIDENGAMVLPASVWKQLGRSGKVMVTPGPDRCVWLMSPEHAQCVLQRVEKTAVTDDVVRAFRRLYFAQTEKADVDSEGGVAVPAKMVEYAGLAKEVIIVGVEDHFELWDAKRWQAYSMGKSSQDKPYGKERAPIPAPENE